MHLKPSVIDAPFTWSWISNLQRYGHVWWLCERTKRQWLWYCEHFAYVWNMQWRECITMFLCFHFQMLNLVEPVAHLHVFFKIFCKLIWVSGVEKWERVDKSIWECAKRLILRQDLHTGNRLYIYLLPRNFMHWMHLVCLPESVKQLLMYIFSFHHVNMYIFYWIPSYTRVIYIY